MFIREDGVFLRPERVSKRFQTLAADAGLPRIRLHDLRHSDASDALEAGAKVEVLSKRLGHSKISITQDIYLHVRETADREVADTVARALLGPPVSTLLAAPPPGLASGGAVLHLPTSQGYPRAQMQPGHHSHSIVPGGLEVTS